jgi:putative transposase
LVDELKKRLAERMLNGEGEMDHHLSAEAEEEARNHRNGYSSKTVLTDTGRVELAIPPGPSRALGPGANRQIPATVRRLRRQGHRAVHARNDTREIAEHVGELYGPEISPTR